MVNGREIKSNEGGKPWIIPEHVPDDTVGSDPNAAGSGEGYYGALVEDCLGE
jgi:hypothetical protein